MKTHLPLLLIVTHPITWLAATVGVLALIVIVLLAVAVIATIAVGSFAGVMGVFLSLSYVTTRAYVQREWGKLRPEAPPVPEEFPLLEPTPTCLSGMDEGGRPELVPSCAQEVSVDEPGIAPISNMGRAINLVLQRGTPVRQAARVYEVSATSLRRKLKAVRGG